MTREIRPATKNANKHTERGLTALQKSIQSDGWIGAMTTAADGEMIAGSARLETAGHVFTPDVEPIVIETDGTRPIVVVRTDIPDASDKKAQRLALADNRIQEFDLTWNVEVLAGFDAETLGALWTGEELSDLGEQWANEQKAKQVDPGAQVDRAAELQEKWGTELGQLWQLGEHRLICGDCTDAAVVQRVTGGELAQLVYTDPPYGVDYDGGTKVREKLEGDSTTDLYMPACRMATDFSDDESALYLWHAGVKGIAAAAAAAAAGYEIRCELVWNKNQAQFGALSAQYKQKHEPMYYCFKRGHAPRWFGPTNEVTVWDCDRASVNEFHPTQKPVELAERAMRNSSESSDVVLDLFLGSGATLIAWERLGRKCRGMEISPCYVAVALQRWAEMTGKVPELIE